MIRVTVEDLETGDTDSMEIMDNYIVVCAGDRYIASEQRHANGTVVLTIKRDREVVS